MQLCVSSAERCVKIETSNKMTIRTIPPEYKFFEEHPKVDYLWEDTSCEIVFFQKVMELVLADPIAQDYHFYILNEEPLPVKNKKVIAIQIGLEKHLIPNYTEEVALVFTTYPPAGKIPNNLRAIPLGYNGDVPIKPMLPFLDRTTTAFFAGQNSNERWKIGAAIDHLKNKQQFLDHIFEIQYSSKFRTGLSAEQYAQKMMNSQIALVPQGTFSAITFRFFEAARAGNIIISCALPETWYFENFPGIQVEDWAALENILPTLLADPEKMLRLHEETKSYYQRYCSEQAVANYILKEIKKSTIFAK